MTRDPNRSLRSLLGPMAQTLRQLHWQPAADVYRTRDGVLVKLARAGVRPEDIHVEAQGSRLTVKGARRDWAIGEGCSSYTMEITYSQFHRSLELPCDLAKAELSSEYR